MYVFPLQAIWENQFYYLFGFLFLVFIILVVSCSQISIVMVYFQLCAEVSLIHIFLLTEYFLISWLNWLKLNESLFKLANNLTNKFMNWSPPLHFLWILIYCVVFVSQDYRWWWRTFLVSGGSAFYVLIYAVFYFANKVKHKCNFCLAKQISIPRHYFITLMSITISRRSMYTDLCTVH